MDYQLKIAKNPAFWSAGSAFVAGVLAHMFGIVTVLHNYDSINHFFNGFGSSLSLGRWFLKILGSLSEELLGSYNLTWFNSVAFLFLLAVSAYFLTDALEIQSRTSCILIGIAFVTYPTVVSTLFLNLQQSITA